jgi:hypothetical protein
MDWASSKMDLCKILYPEHQRDKSARPLKGRKLAKNGICMEKCEKWFYFNICPSFLSPMSAAKTLPKTILRYNQSIGNSLEP